MDNPNVYECELDYLSLERAKDIVPPEFVEAWDWYLLPEHASFKNLPHRDRSIEKPSFITLSSDAGIHCPSYSRLKSKGCGNPRYVLAVHAGSSIYSDRDLILRDDGTWILDYCAHKTNQGSREVAYYNEAMMNNLRDGIPVIVLVKQNGGGYRNYGLAYVEQYNAITDTFILHGPATMESEGYEFFSLIDEDDLSEETKRLLDEWDDRDERKTALVRQVRREGQGRFRDLLIGAYGGRCTATGIDVIEALQAAHIDGYRAKKYQIVNNGILLRSDIHLLYDSHLLTIRPDSMRIELGDRLVGSEYESLDNQQIRLPKKASDRPSEKLLDIHYQGFKAARA